MISASTALRRGLFGALNDNAPLLAVLDGPRIFDRVPERVSPPYVVAGRSTVSDWSTSTGDGEAIVFFVHVWTKRTSRDEADTIAALVKTAVLEHMPPLDGHNLVNLRFQLTETRRDRASGHVHSVLRFRAVTEPAV